LGDERATLDLHRYRRQVGVAVVSCRLDGVRGAVHGLGERALVQVELGFGHPQPSVLDAVGVLLDVSEAAAQPADRDRALTTVEMVVEQPRRGPSRTPVILGVPERGVCPLASGDRLVGPAQPPGRLGQRIEFDRRKADRVTGAKILVDVEPGPGSHGLSYPLRARSLVHADLPWKS